MASKKKKSSPVSKIRAHLPSIARIALLALVVGAGIHFSVKAASERAFKAGAQEGCVRGLVAAIPLILGPDATPNVKKIEEHCDAILSAKE